jgi:general secretion pathway protein D
VIAEVTLNDALRYGVNWFFHSGGGAVARSTPITTSSDPAGFGAIINTGNVTAVIRSLSALTTVKVISAPRLLVLDNRTATLQVGDQVPILTQTSESQQSPNSPVINQVQLRDTGVILAVTPRIGANSNVTLDLYQEVSAPTRTSTSAIDSPTIAVRRVQSTVSVESGDTVALGGLMQDQSNQGHSGIPFLSSVPIIGGLFGSKQQDVRRTELLVLITPRIVARPDDLGAITNELREKMSELAPDVATAVTPSDEGQGGGTGQRKRNRGPQLDLMNNAP